MTVLETISKPSADVHDAWGDIIDSVAQGRPVLIRRPQDNVIMLNLPTFNSLFAPLKFHVSIIPESDGSFTGVVDELDLVENAETKERCVAALIAAMKDYAQDFYNEFNLWSAAPNRRAHIPYVLKVLSSSDAQLMEDVICRAGKI